MINPWSSRNIENHKAQLKSYHDQANSSYRREEMAIGAQYTAELEQYRASCDRDLQHLKHSQQLDIEQGRSGLAKWVEEFRQKTGLQIEGKRQEGALVLQEREHVHRRLLIELDTAQRRASDDQEHARRLEVANKTDELSTFQRQREAVYSLEAQNFSALIAERQSYTVQLLSEFQSRNTAGQTVVSTVSSLLVNGANANDKMNEMILAAVIAKHAEEQRRRNARDEEVGRAVDDVVDGWKRGEGGT